MVRVIIVIFMCLLFWLICFLNTGSDKKNMLGFRSYPKEVQEAVRKDPLLGNMAPEHIDLGKVLLENILLFTVIFFVVGIILKYTTGFINFYDAFIYFLILGETINLFDLVVIDLIWWRNSKRIRYSSIQDKKLYQNPKVHIDSFIRGCLMYFVIAIFVGRLITLLP